MCVDIFDKRGITHQNAQPLRAYAPVAQLDRVPGYEPGGRRFESFRARHINQRLGRFWLSLFRLIPVFSHSVSHFMFRVVGSLNSSYQRDAGAFLP